MDHLLEIRNLSIELPQGRRKPPVKLVEGVDLTVRKKQNFGVVGESGCGKSITCSSCHSRLVLISSIERWVIVHISALGCGERKQSELSLITGMNFTVSQSKITDAYTFSK